MRQPTTKMEHEDMVAFTSFGFNGDTFVVDDQKCDTMDRFMNIAAARLFGDAEAEAEVLGHDSPYHRPSIMGHGEIEGFRASVWLASCFDIAVRGNYAMFSQNPAMKAELLATGTKTLVYASPPDASSDPIWGTYTSLYLCENKKTWGGQNLLGEVLEKVREMLREQRY